MINELKNDINNESINHAYFLECNDEKKALEEENHHGIEAVEMMTAFILNQVNHVLFLIYKVQD